VFTCARKVYGVISSIVTVCKATLHKPPFVNGRTVTALNIRRRVYLIPFQAVLVTKQWYPGRRILKEGVKDSKSRPRRRPRRAGITAGSQRPINAV